MFSVLDILHYYVEVDDIPILERMALVFPKIDKLSSVQISD